MASILSRVLGNNQYTLGELMQVDQGRSERSAGCSVKLLNTYHELRKESLLDKFKSLFVTRGLINVYYLIFKFEVTSETGGVHTVFLRTNPDFDLVNWTSNKVQVYCSCNDFKFRSAYELNKRNSLFKNDRLKTQLGVAITEPPKRTNPSVSCKHSLAAINWLVQNYQSIMKTI